MAKYAMMKKSNGCEDKKNQMDVRRMAKKLNIKHDGVIA
jgi:hypothetical protein